MGECHNRPINELMRILTVCCCKERAEREREAVNLLVDPCPYCDLRLWLVIERINLWIQVADGVFLVACLCSASLIE